MFDPIALQAHHSSIKEHGCCRIAGCGVCGSRGAPVACGARYVHRAPGVEVVCTCTHPARHPTNYHEDESVGVRWPVVPASAAALTDAENTGDRGPRERAPKPFPMPGTRWMWRGNEQATTPTGPHQVESLRWFAGGVEAVFAADPRYPGYACAGVDHMMKLDAWECIGGVFAVPDHRLAAAAIGLDCASVQVLTWIASRLPASKLRATCEEIAARGWVRPDAQDVKVPMGPEDRAFAELLSVVRTIEGLLFRDSEGRPVVTPRRSREEVLGDAARRGGAK